MSNFISDYQLPHYQLSISIVLWELWSTLVLWDYSCPCSMGLWSTLLLWDSGLGGIWSEGGDDQGVGTVYDGGFKRSEVDAGGRLGIVSHPFAYDAQRNPF